VILSLNRISPDKSDYHQLLYAFACLHQSRTIQQHLRLAIVGGVSPADRGYAKSLKKYAEQLNIHKHVCIIEHLDEKLKPHILAAADVFVAPSCNPQESFGVVLLEALAAGLPIVATDWNGYPEVLSPFYEQFMVPTMASHAVARAIDWTRLTEASAPSFDALLRQLERLASDEQLRKRLGAWGQEYVARFRWQSTAEQLVALWEQLLGERSVNGECSDAAGPAQPPWQPESPVDGLATGYLGAGTRVALARKAGRRPLGHITKGSHFEQDKHRLALLVDICGASGAAGITLDRLRTAAELGIAECDRLVLQLLRYGGLQLANDD